MPRYRSLWIIPAQGPSGPDRCCAYYWTRPVQGGSLASSKLLGKSCSSSSASAHHWVVMFEYEDEVLVCDAVELAGELTGRCESKGKDEFRKGYPKKKYLGEYNFPKEFVKETVKNMMKYGPYDPLSNN
ncbi:uncharacterized protein LOC144139380 isoform X2 [Haemaphysalis longicornis]